MFSFFPPSHFIIQASIRGLNMSQAQVAWPFSPACTWRPVMSQSRRSEQMLNWKPTILGRAATVTPILRSHCTSCAVSNSSTENVLSLVHHLNQKSFLINSTAHCNCLCPGLSFQVPPRAPWSFCLHPAAQSTGQLDCPLTMGMTVTRCLSSMAPRLSRFLMAWWAPTWRSLSPFLCGWDMAPGPMRRRPSSATLTRQVTLLQESLLSKIMICAASWLWQYSGLPFLKIVFYGKIGS